MKIISGGQTGADLGGVIAAKLCGIETGGWMPKGFKNHDGLMPQFKEMFCLKEHSDVGYKSRTWKNIEDSDITIRIACNFNSPGEKCTLNGIKHHKKPYIDILVDKNNPVINSTKVIEVMHKIKNCEVVNIAGNARKTWDGMGYYTVEFMCSVFLMMGYNRTSLRHLIQLDNRYKEIL